MTQFLAYYFSVAGPLVLGWCLYLVVPVPEPKAPADEVRVNSPEPSDILPEALTLPASWLDDVEHCYDFTHEVLRYKGFSMRIPSNSSYRDRLLWAWRLKEHSIHVTNTGGSRAQD
jgi:hypothetical protein